MSTQRTTEYYFASSDMYQVLGSFLVRPTRELAHALYTGMLASDIRSILQELCFSERRIDNLLADLEVPVFEDVCEEDFFHAIRKDYTHLFSNPTFSVLTLYEARFLGSEQYLSGKDIALNNVVLKARRAYKDASFTSSIIPALREDHMAVQFEFMQLLRQNQGLTQKSDHTAQCREISQSSQSFFDEHVKNWGVDFYEKVFSLAEETVYRVVGRLGVAFLESESGSSCERGSSQHRESILSCNG